MESQRPVIPRDGLILIASLAVIAAATAVLRMFLAVSPTTVALALLLVVLATATLSRLWVAIVASIAAMLALNFFFLPPVGTFTIADPQNWVALFAFLIVAVIASQLSAAARDREREAVSRRNEVTRLFDLSRDVLLTETAGGLDALTRHISRRFELAKVAVCLPGDHGWETHQGGEKPVAFEEVGLERTLHAGHASVMSAAGEQVSLIPLRHGTKAIGVLAAVAPGVDLGTLDAVAGVAAIAIERVQFLREREAAAIVRQKADLASMLLASLSHDLRTPLTAIRVAVENLRQDSLETDARREQVQVALLELDRLTRLFQDILDMARIDAQGIVAASQWVSPADIVDAATAYVRHALEGRTVRVEATSDADVEVDPRLVSAALAHLLENAAQYSPRDQPIGVAARAGASGFEVSVTDKGTGLDPGELDHLFERFYRGRLARQASFGTGMGLAITRGLLAAAGGRVWAENVPGAGARFTIAVPCATRAAAGAE
jgi:two-component system sensor histidine kinase KdpD